MGSKDLIIVEGADCMGKTTLVANLQKWLGYPAIHTGGPKTDAQLEATCQMVEGLIGPYIVDRAPHLSEIAYRPVTRDGEVVPPAMAETFIDRLVAINPLIIVCRRKELPNLQAVERPHKSLEYWAKVSAGYLGLVERYDGLIEVLKDRASVFVFDWTDPMAEANLREWLNFYIFGEV